MVVRKRSGLSRFALAASASLGYGVIESLTGAFAQSVQDRTLSKVTAQESGACSTVTVEFNVPVRYTSHFPETSGRELRIAVQPLSFNRGNVSRSFGTESVRPPSSKITGIQQITYDLGGAAGPTLVLQFDHDAHWSVQSGKDVQQIVIHIARGDSDDCLTGEKGKDASERQLANPILAITSTIPDRLDPAGNYSINLSSNRGRNVLPESVKPLDAFSRFAAYGYSAEENGVTWARLRLGMFSARAEAEAVLAEVRSTYPDAWVVRIDRTERDRVYQAWLAARGEFTGVAQTNAASQMVDPAAEKIVADVRSRLDAGEYSEAVRLAQSAVSMPLNAATPLAQELLGLARERAGQLAHAKAEYEAFLDRFPQNEGAGRVRQRLAALLGEEQPEAQQAASDGTSRAGGKEQKLRAEASGSLSVLYQRDESGFLFEDIPIVGGPIVNPDPVEQNQTNLDEFLFGADLNVSVGNDRSEALFRFSGVYRDDLRIDAPRDEGAVSALYLDLSDREFNASARLGRQTRNTGGVFGRFDGGLVGFQATDRIKLNAVAGYPVQSSRDLKVDNSRRFVGASVDVALVSDKLDTTLYYFDQTIGGLVDRRAAGFEFRYIDAFRTAYGVFDYDTHYGQMNLALLNATQRFKDDSSVSLAVDYRRAPLLATQNAIFGQGVDDPNDLLGAYTAEQLYELAQDRTAYSRSASISYSRPLTDKLQFNTDVIASNVSGTKTSGGVDAQPPTGTEYYYSAQLVGSDLFKEGAIGVAGLRFADLSKSNQYTLQFNVRYPLTRDFRINPKLRLDQREQKDGSASEITARGSVALTLNMNRDTHFELELGGQYSDAKTMLVATRETGYFLTAGVRRDF